MIVKLIPVHSVNSDNSCFQVPHKQVRVTDQLVIDLHIISQQYVLTTSEINFLKLYNAVKHKYWYKWMRKYRWHHAQQPDIKVSIIPRHSHIFACARKVGVFESPEKKCFTEENKTYWCSGKVDSGVRWCSSSLLLEYFLSGIHLVVNSSFVVVWSWWWCVDHVMVRSKVCSL